MASLADELDLDPAFHDASLGIHGGTSVSFDDREGQESSTSLDQSPIRKRGGRGGRGGRRGARGSYSSDGSEQYGPPQAGLGEGYSLADELGGGSEQPTITNILYLAGGVVGGSEYGDEEQLINGGSIDEETKARRDREYYLTSSESLNASLRTTEGFLEKLKLASLAPGIAEKGRLLPSAGSASSLFGPGVPSDDTSSLEGKAGNVLKQMREHSSTREEQIRELQECDRMLRRALEDGGDWISALANVDDLENDSIDDIKAEDDALAFISRTPVSKRSDRRHLRRDISGSMREDDAVLDEDDGSRSIESSASFTRLPLSNLTLNEQHAHHCGEVERYEEPNVTICQELASLQHHTMDLVVSLGSIHEQSQVARAPMTDAARRIKTIKTVLSNWSAEIEAAEQSQSHILSWESLEGADSGTRPRDIREWTSNQMDKFERILNDASEKARELLSPVHDSVLDQLLAQG